MWPPRAKEARKEADRLACEAWTKRMLGFRGPAQPSPALGDALNAGYLYLEVRCLGCDTHQTVALDVVRRPKATPVHELERYMRCKDCSQVRGYAYKEEPLGGPDRSLGIGYTGGSSILLACVLCSLAAWYVALGSINVQTVATPKVEVFYWVTITFSQTLGTALGDWIADGTGLGYDGGALVFCAGLALLGALYYWTAISRVFLFWAAFILTRPLGATVGDFLDKPTSHGGLALSRPLASGVILGAIVVLVLVLPQRPGRHPGSPSVATQVP